MKFTDRSEMLKYYFPTGVPRLWCPLLAHYRDDGGLDFQRMEAHFNFVAAQVKGFLIPGSTGDGWELSDRETAAVVEFALKVGEEKRFAAAARGSEKIRIHDDEPDRGHDFRFGWEPGAGISAGH